LNQFCAQADSPRSFAGFSLTGFQLLLPVSPELCLFFFDQKVYKVGSRSSRLVAISSKDVEIINALQFQSADTCIYFNELDLEPRLRAWATKYTGLRSSVRETLQHIPGRDDREEFLHMRAAAGRLPSQWDFCRYRRKITAQIGSRRDIAWSESIERLMRDLDANPLRPNEHILTRHQKVIDQMETVAVE
jgi:hypothetical protein